MAITVTAYTNSDRTMIVWRTDARIDGCLGFAIERQRRGAVSVLSSSVGFSGDKAGTGDAHPTHHRVADDYRWRYYMSMSGAPTAGAPPPSGLCDPAHKWDGLIRADCWQDGYLNDPAKQRELRFWLGER